MSTALVKRTHYRFPSRESYWASQCAVRAIWCLAKGFELLAWSQTAVATIWFARAGEFGVYAAAFSLADRYLSIRTWKEFCGAKA